LVEPGEAADVLGVTVELLPAPQVSKDSAAELDGRRPLLLVLPFAFRRADMTPARKSI
jgi:hypothetical protein